VFRYRRNSGEIVCITRRECVASPNSTVTRYYFVRTCGLLRYCYRPSSVVCQSVTVVSPAKQLKRSSCRLGSGLWWAEGTMYYMGSRSHHEKGQLWRGKGRTIVKYSDTMRSSVQTQLNWSRCHFGCGLAWAQGIVLDGGPERLSWSIWHLGCGLQWAEGCTSSIVFARWRQCALIEPSIYGGDPPYVKLLSLLVIFRHDHLDSRTDGRALRAEYCIVCIPHNTAI